MSFKDHFSGHAAAYAHYRPDYPAELFEYLATLTPRCEYALDCATGSGQAAVGLATHFQCVVGTDGSLEQLRNALAHERVHYVASIAEQSAFRAGTFDLVCAAQAAHWFDHARFYPAVREALGDDGALALWTYGLAQIDPEIDRIVHEFYSTALGEYWPPERRHVESGYRTLPFPLHEIVTPSFELRLQWDLDALMGYLGTWSAVQRYRTATQLDPLPALRQRLAAIWGPVGQNRTVVWPLHLRVGRF